MSNKALKALATKSMNAALDRAAELESAGQMAAAMQVLLEAIWWDGVKNSAPA